MLTGIAENNGITMQTDIIQDSSILIIEDDLYQIIFNLVENGIKYNTPGGKLTVTLYREEENAVIAVKDTGVGIPEESVGHVFERFYRVDKARARKTGGSGLGLSIVRNMVERNGGQISLESKVGEGSLFTLRFPVFDTEESQ
jgi:signal transduction histidine kinase